VSEGAPRVNRGGEGADRIPMSDHELSLFYRSVFLPLVRRATWKHHLSKEDARDIVQDAFLVAIQRIDATGNPKAWLIQVVDHLAINYQRKRIRRSLLTAKWGQRCETAPSESLRDIRESPE
jgi:DNA-directed RNA polymerase specialized sigma24 family protein